MIIIGIDPGKSGGIAFMDTDGVNNAWVYKMPETEADVVDVLISVNDIIHDGKVVAYLEEVSAMPKQGVSSVFAFGRSYGFLRGVLSALKITRHFVRPQAWQKEQRPSIMPPANLTFSNSAGCSIKWAQKSPVSAVIC